MVIINKNLDRGLLCFGNAREDIRSGVITEFRIKSGKSNFYHKKSRFFFSVSLALLLKDLFSMVTENWFAVSKITLRRQE